jgi:hypothetical protein
MRALFVAFLLAGTVVTGGQQSARQPATVNVDGTTRAVKDCECGTAYRTTREWRLHRPATPQERAETGRLNREYLAASRAAPLPPPPGPDPAQLAYQERMKNYRALTQSYERRMRDYNRLHAQASVPPADQSATENLAAMQ